MNEKAREEKTEWASERKNKLNQQAILIGLGDNFDVFGLTLMIIKDNFFVLFLWRFKNESKQTRYAAVFAYL